MIHHFRQHSNHATCEEWIYNTSHGADHNRRCPTHRSLGGRHLLNHSRGMGVTFLVSICAAHSAAGVAMHPTPVPLNQACLPTKHTTRLCPEANIRQPQAFQNNSPRPDPLAPPFPTSLSFSQSFQPDILVFASHFSLELNYRAISKLFLGPSYSLAPPSPRASHLLRAGLWRITQ